MGGFPLQYLGGPMTFTITALPTAVGGIQLLAAESNGKCSAQA